MYMALIGMLKYKVHINKVEISEMVRAQAIQSKLEHCFSCQCLLKSFSWNKLQLIATISNIYFHNNLIDNIKDKQNM